ncbi:phospholipase D-like domain-containing protein [Nocardioides psychrotolerans]|uniref:phospholipase D-like domain-containing protein n=1 Tax=Nocardioides psychrotolerans TaxID=1005945 RepID=UPI003137A372
MRRLSAATVLATSLTIVVSLLGALPSTAAPTRAATQAVGQAVGQGASLTQAPAVAAKPRKRKGPKPAPDKYTPPAGVKFNNPLAGKESRGRIRRHLIRTIDSVPGREQIRVASWNVKSTDIQNALARAHERGVSVRVIIDRGNAGPAKPNPGFDRMANRLRAGQKSRMASQKSGTRKCVSSCRYYSGIAHTKFFMFSQAGKAKNVVIYGSNNATDLAAHSQWNDMFTVRGQGNIYQEFLNVFDQMYLDKPVKQSYLTYQHGSFTSYFYPFKGKDTKSDPLMRDLNDIRCKGATGGTGTKGRTKIRIAQTSMHGDRGKQIANKLRDMYENGCDIKIVYAVFGNNVLKILRNTNRGRIPIRQIAQDFDLDGVYDKYLHMKNMAVSGVYKGRTDANVTWNGSANWTQVALVSDEIVMRIVGPRIRAQYANWVDFLYANPPRFTGAVADAAAAARRTAIANGIRPESGIEVN